MARAVLATAIVATAACGYRETVTVGNVGPDGAWRPAAASAETVILVGRIGEIPRFVHSQPPEIESVVLAEPESAEAVRPSAVSAARVEEGGMLAWIRVIFPEWAWSRAFGIGSCESGGNSNATGSAGERGYFQIHPIHFDSTYDPEGNVRAAYRISRGGSDWSAWSCAR